MPITISLSTEARERGCTLTDATKAAVEKARTYSIWCVRAARNKVVTKMSAEVEALFEAVFLNEPTSRNCTTALGIYNKTLDGLRADHGIKLGKNAYVKEKYGALGGPFGTIHLSLIAYEGKGFQADLQAWTYIHEASHKFANTVDVGDRKWSMFGDTASGICYLDRDKALKESEVRYQGVGLRADSAMNNADSYACFAILLERMTTGLYRPKSTALVATP